MYIHTHPHPHPHPHTNTQTNTHTHTHTHTQIHNLAQCVNGFAVEVLPQVHLGEFFDVLGLEPHLLPARPPRCVGFTAYGLEFGV